MYCVCQSPGDPASILGGVRNFNLHPGTGCVLSYVVPVGGPDIVLTSHSERPALGYLSSVLVHSPLLPPTGFLPIGNLGFKSRKC